MSYLKWLNQQKFYLINFIFLVSPDIGAKMVKLGKKRYGAISITGQSVFRSNYVMVQ